MKLSDFIIVIIIIIIVIIMINNIVVVVVIIIIIVVAVVTKISGLVDNAGLRRRLQGPAPVMVMGQASQHNYSAHMSTSLALGFLFMAGGAATFSTSPQATAALVIALFPRFPHSPTDHRCHLQVCVCFLQLL